MKKILILLLVAFALSANAQRPYQIESQLKLGTVNAGTASDSVLVRGADKIVKFVPRSEFSSGGGSELTLDDVIANGNQVLNRSFSLTNGSTQTAYYNMTGVTFYNTGYGEQGRFDSGKASVQNSSGLTDYYPTRIRNKVTGGIDNFFNFPTIPDEEPRTLAITDDIVPIYTSGSFSTPTQADLNLYYPSAKIGTQVQSISTEEASFIYIKTASGWVSTAVTLLP